MILAMLNRGRFLSLQLLVIFLSAFILIHFFPVGGTWDMVFIQPWIDEQGHFPLKNSWALATLNHHYVKNIVIAVYVIFCMLWLKYFRSAEVNIYNKQQAYQYGYIFFLVILSTSVIGIIKSQSASACPWDMTVPNTHGFRWDFSSTTGHCFPGGHASTGFALFAGYFALRISHPKRAYFYAISAIILGFAMGWAQMMRGAHFLSHNLWTAWVIWVINCIAYAICSPYLGDAEMGKNNVTFNPPKVVEVENSKPPFIL